MKTKLIKTITIPALEETNVKDFFESRNAWTSDRFKDWILSKASTTVSAKETKDNIYTLTDYAYDSEIQQEINTKPKSVDEYLTSIISRIKNGNQELLTNSYGNIEHVDLGGRIVAVYCYFDGFGWYFGCFELDEVSNWNGGRQFSTPATLSNKDTLDRPLETLTLEKAIELVKEHGMKVYKEM